MRARSLYIVTPDQLSRVRYQSEKETLFSGAMRAIDQKVLRMSDLVLVIDESRDCSQLYCNIVKCRYSDSVIQPIVNDLIDRFVYLNEIARHLNIKKFCIDDYLEEVKSHLSEFMEQKRIEDLEFNRAAARERAEEWFRPI